METKEGKSKYEFAAGTGLLTGEDGETEKLVRRVLVAGLEWWDRNPGLKPKYGHLGREINHLIPLNKAADAMNDAMIQAAERTPLTPLVHAKVVQLIIVAHYEGWDWLQEKIKEFALIEKAATN